MTPKAPRTPFNSTTLVRLLSSLGSVDVAHPEPSLAERLGLWLGWAEAISLSSVLGAAAPALKPADKAHGATGGSLPAGAVAKACAEVRAALARAITADERFATAPTPLPKKSNAPPAEPPVEDDPASFAPYRRSYVAHQRAMESGIAPLRAQVRAALARCSPALGQLAALDEVMEGVVAPHERSALAGVPTLLERRFKRLRETQPVSAVADEDGARAPRPAWLDGHRRDIQAVLLAELDIRLQPVEGLIDALGQEISRPLP